MEEMGMSVAQYSTFGSIMTIGGMLGSLVNGKIGDLIGRRYTMWVSEVFFMASWFIIAFAKVSWLLDLGRFIMGFAVAITAYVVPVYIAKITPKSIRGTLTSTQQFMITFGFSIVYLVGTVISWRALALVGAVPWYFKSLAYSSSQSLPNGWQSLGEIKSWKRLSSTLGRRVVMFLKKHLTSKITLSSSREFQRTVSSTCFNENTRMHSLLYQD
ncbi:Sugar transporter ESL1 [Linum perenne]